MTRAKPLLLVTLIATTAACGDATGPAQLTTFSIELYTDQAPLPSVTAAGGYRTAVIGGGYWVPCDGVMPAHIEAGVVLDEIGLQLQVRWPGDVDNCSPSVVSFVYQATVEALEPGTYELQVIHVTGQDAFIALEQELTVR